MESYKQKDMNAKSVTPKVKPYLFVPHVPPKVTTADVFDLVSKYGECVAVRNSSKNSHYFVEFKSIDEMLKVHVFLKKNIYGISFYIGREFVSSPRSADHFEREKTSHEFNESQQSGSCTEAEDICPLDDSSILSSKSFEEDYFGDSLYDAFESLYDFNKCAVCNDSCDLCCARCGTSYCDEFCQKYDWKRHRPICTLLAMEKARRKTMSITLNTAEDI